MKFTKEEISLCKQVAKKHRKEIERREYLYNTFSKRVQWSGEGGQAKTTWAIPLWTISDCLEFLREKGFYLSINTLGEYWICLAYKYIFDEENKNIGPRIFFQEKTLLSTCLKTVLAVLEEKSGQVQLIH